MAKESTQKKLSRVRPPRVQIKDQSTLGQLRELLDIPEKNAQ